MRAFSVIRKKKNGTYYEVGHLIDGVEFEDGTVVIRWRSKMGSTAIYKNLNDFSTIHIEDHPEYNSELIWRKIEELIKQSG